MADRDDIWDDNIGGSVTLGEKRVSFYVDKTCIFCALCHGIAPENFTVSEDETHDLIYKQPTSEEELGLCYEALEECPVDAIGDDG
tara:strand:- start:2408 stop:2665 length:258 start_codon:yes stop_codon:yes gene_type:complete